MSELLWQEYREAQDAEALPPEPYFQEILEKAALEAEFERKCKNGEERAWASTRWRAKAAAPEHAHNQRKVALVEARVALLQSLHADALEDFKAEVDAYVEQWQRAVVVGRFTTPIISVHGIAITCFGVAPFSPLMEVKGLDRVKKICLKGVVNERTEPVPT